jgi:hypothetical protein
MPELLASLAKASGILPFKRIRNAMYNPKDHDTETHTDKEYSSKEKGRSTGNNLSHFTTPFLRHTLTLDQKTQ